MSSFTPRLGQFKGLKVQCLVSPAIFYSLLEAKAQCEHENLAKTALLLKSTWLC